MTTFSDLGLSDQLLRGLDDLNFVKPTPIQAQAIPTILKTDQDVIALAQTGTGKTAAFSIPVIEKMDPKQHTVQAIILCPTRELCRQITQDIANFTKHIGKIDVTAVYGGASARDQIRDLKQGTQIVVGTPGRVADLINRRALDISNINWLVLDEADEMLTMGFKDELDSILATTPKTKQTLLFSATMPADIRRIAQKYMHNPQEITTGMENKSADKVEHHYYVAHARDRYATLRRIADAHPEIYAIVFCRTRRETKEVADKLIKDHYAAEAIHGEVDQNEREAVMKRFREGHTQMLVATDVAARGIDVSELTHVINYNLPDDRPSYIHRSGRTGRAHSSGISISIIHMRERNRIRQLEKHTGKQFIQKQIPGGKEICQAQLRHLITKTKAVKVDEPQLASFMPLAVEMFADFDREELIKHFLAVEFNRFLEHYQNAPDLNQGVDSKGGSSRDHSGGRSDRQRDRRKGDRNSNSELSFAKFSINLGKKHNFRVKDLFGFINSEPKLKGLEIGDISIESGTTYFEVDAGRADQVAKAFHNVETESGYPLTVKQEKGSGHQGGSRSRGRSKKRRRR